MRWQRPWVGVVAGFVGSFGAATCDRRETRAEAEACPPCECVCKPETLAASSAPPVSTPPPVVDPGKPLDTSAIKAEAPQLPAPLDPRIADLAELVAGASRKMMHGDGKGCLADLDRVAAIDAKLDARMAVSRGQCEMLVGKCQAGKARVAQWYVDETAMHPERAATTAETIGSMRCRDGDSTDRDRLLRAFYELSDGAYMNKKPAAACKQQLALATKLIPKVPAKNAEDTQISGGAQALFHTAAQCFAHADDCKAAWATYKSLFPGKGLEAIPDPGERDNIVGTSFDSTITRCTGKR